MPAWGVTVKSDSRVEKALQQLRSGDTDRLTRRLVIDREFSLIEAHEKNLVDAIAKRQQMDPLLAKLKAEEARKKELIEELGRLTQPADVIDFDAARMKRELRIRIIDAKGLLDRQRSESCQVLRKLIDQPLQFEVFEENGAEGYRVTGKGNYLAVLPTSLVSPIVASPTGRDQVDRGN
jgi:hypothetical protein